MPLRSRRHLAALLLAIGAALGLASPAVAHNELTGSEPAGGAALESAPPQIVLRFANPAPLDTASVEVIDSSGARSEVAGLTHGPSGDTEIVAPLPALKPGALTVRWRLVGPDGHPVTGRVPLTIGAAAAAGTGESPAPTDGSAAAAVLDEPRQVPGLVRWTLRWISYVAIIGLAGLLGAAAWLLPASWRSARVRQWALLATATIGGLGAAQLLVLAGDIAGSSPLSAWAELGTAVGTTAGTAFAIRMVVAALLAFVLLTTRVADETRWWAAGSLSVVLLGTWAFAGHAGSMRWAVIGVPLDIAHHAAAALWLGGLVVISRLALVNATAESVIAPVQRFARLAPIAVGILVATGVIQSIRLTGMPDQTLGSAHTRLLLFKLLALGVMLRVADINRRRVARRFTDAHRVRRGLVTALRRAMAVEFALGLIVVAFTAAMVVSPPPVASEPAALKRGTAPAPTP